MKKLKELWNRLFGKKKAPVPVPVVKPSVQWPFPEASSTAVPTFTDGFDSGKIDPAKWTVSTWTAPMSTSTHKGTFLAKNATIVDGVLCLTLTQSTMSYGISSKGAEIATVDKFHYGTFEWSMRASSTSATADGIGTPVSGSITGCFVYLTGAQTEIDIEVEGNERNRTTQLTSWVGESNPNEHTDVSPISDSQLPHIGFHDYKFVWTPDEIEFYRDNVLIGTHTKVVPTEPANVMINHWGTNDKDWGGLATPDVTRYMWVKNFRYTPL